VVGSFVGIFGKWRRPIMEIPNQRFIKARFGSVQRPTCEETAFESVMFLLSMMLWAPSDFPSVMPTLRGNA